MPLNSKKLKLIFDFDGTIADSHQFVIDAYNQLAGQYGCSFVDLASSKDVPLHEALEASGVSNLRRFLISKKIKALMKQHIDQIHPFLGLKAVFEQLLQRNISLSIMTSNSRKVVEAFLRAHALEGFEQIYSNASLFAKDRVIKKIIKKHKASSILYVGDEVRDLIAMRKARVPMIAVSWGWNSQELLKQYHPDVVINAPKELLELDFARWVR